MKCPETRTGDVTHHHIAMYQVSVDYAKGYGKKINRGKVLEGFDGVGVMCKV